MSTIVIGSLLPRAGRTTATAALGARLAADGLSVRLARLRSADGADAPAEDDAQVFATVAGCSSSGRALTEQEALTEAADGGSTLLIEAPAGEPKELIQKLSARVVLVTVDVADPALADLASAASALGDALIGVIAVRQQERALEPVAARLSERGLNCLAVIPEDRLLAGPSPRELAEVLHASSLVEGENSDEAVEFVMLGPLSADPGQPYFLQHGTKAVVNRFDKMDLHLAALATEPDCLILTGGQQPSPYLLDRVEGADPSPTVLLAPDSTVQTIQVVDELYGKTRFAGRRKLVRAIELFERLDLTKLSESLS
ncbi:MAG: hypothetical protein J4N95_06580 [Chloroflexi bacterium]|nr:hypothetical protein [Chloroflexota bacterium]